mgnify:CR=1 FL=1
MQQGSLTQARDGALRFFDAGQHRRTARVGVPDVLEPDRDRPPRQVDAGLARVRTRFSAERMVQDTLEVYRRVAMHAHVEA